MASFSFSFYSEEKKDKKRKRKIGKVENLKEVNDVLLLPGFFFAVLPNKEPDRGMVENC